jgi:hypothetical protein
VADVSRPLSIDPFLLIRFVRSYEGAWGGPFLLALREQFACSEKTAKRTLARAVDAGYLESFPDEGHRQRLGYRVPAEVKPGRWRTAAMTRPDPRRSKKTGIFLAAELVGATYEDYLHFFREGVTAFCPSCGRSQALQRDDETPDCPTCRVPDRREDGTVRYRARPMVRGDGFPEEPAPSRSGRDADELRRRLWAKLTRP